MLFIDILGEGDIMSVLLMPSPGNLVTNNWFFLPAVG